MAGRSSERRQGGDRGFASGHRFSQAEKQAFTCQPSGRSVFSPSQAAGSAPPISLGSPPIVCLWRVFLSALSYLLYKQSHCNRTLKRLASRDRRTGLYNQPGFTAELDRWLSEATEPVILFYFVFEEYHQVAQRIDYDEETDFLQSIPRRLQNFIQSPFIAGRIGDGNFILAVREDMDEMQQEGFCKRPFDRASAEGTSGGEKKFLTACYQYKRCRAGKDRAKEAISSLIRDYYSHRSQESPVRMLTEKCRQLIEGKNDVAFDEYTDFEMTELSKTFNQYRKQVEQLAYCDPVFSVGNRPKYFRDAQMLISYDKRRRFDLFCIDICSFSQYNELFSADIGDAILLEVIGRLSRLFGTYLYRINGDVFLGISLSGENRESFTAKLQALLADPVCAGNASLPCRCASLSAGIRQTETARSFCLTVFSPPFAIQKSKIKKP